MRSPRMQFTIRRMMIAVAVIASVLGIGIEGMRLKRARDSHFVRCGKYAERKRLYLILERQCRSEAALYEQEAALHEQLAALHEQVAALHEQVAARRTPRSSAAGSRQNAANALARAIKIAEIAAYYTALKQKYRQAADRPCSPVEPDGPEPKPLD
jgi:hypothetical protein